MADLTAQSAAIHLMGIGGAGMAGLALLLQARGAVVSGCDQESTSTTRELEARGMNVLLGHSADHVDECAAVIHSAAIPAAHPELRAAREQGLPVVKRSRALADLVNAGTLIAVAGTHGKTTTTALAAMALEAAGLDPTALVGGRISEWGGNARIGQSDTYVVEADEYDRSFLQLWPKLAVVTSVETEHLDTYATFQAMEAAFDEFVDRVPESGKIVACVDDAGARRRLQRAGARGLGYGTSVEAELRADAMTYESQRTTFSARWRDESLGEFALALRGRHNVRNALAVIGVLLALGVEPGLAAPALASFSGVERRFQLLGEAKGIAVVDDYAHHPTEVAATLETARQVFGDRRLVVAFQPHLYSRTQAFAAEFGRALSAADVVFVTDIYPAREKPIPGVTSQLVVDSARSALGSERVHSTSDLHTLVAELREELQAGDVLMTLGAGNINSVAHDLAAELRRSDVDA
jgi:UDP-N-acetylmuramate--alanine ligase